MGASNSESSVGYKDIGRGPAVVFVRGEQADRSNWLAHVETLASRGFRVVTLDPEAFEEAGSKALGGGSGAERLVRLMDYLGIGRAALVWTGRGEAVVKALISRYPGRVASMVPAGVAVLVEEFSARVGGVFLPAEMQRAAV
ncbi:hypothetical protein DESUT3_21400 [Desulfuromonas versatilis]|uniref:Alpha/beta hydrolase n=1 Tax=Desulfuromonas versatilis TaxID=2802975 RepID=A0ABN6DY67_9BACT|nr:hypothetical protein [Desulfuromonas versatilis]BCR05071.1 hypothetical protein DESUT3_21400 [Desulfuromonas versatilis]